MCTRAPRWQPCLQPVACLLCCPRPHGQPGARHPSHARPRSSPLPVTAGARQDGCSHACASGALLAVPGEVCCSGSPQSAIGWRCSGPHAAAAAPRCPHTPAAGAQELAGGDRPGCRQRQAVQRRSCTGAEAGAGGQDRHRLHRRVLCPCARGRGRRSAAWHMRDAPGLTWALLQAASRSCSASGAASRPATSGRSDSSCASP